MTIAPSRPRTPSPWRVVRLTVLVAAVVVLGGVAVVLFGLMSDGTHFDRPSAEFDALEAEVVALPGVTAVAKERWVEAPTFSNPMSTVTVTLERSALPAVLETACATDYPDPVTWGLVVGTPGGAEVSMFAERVASGTGSACPDFRLDAVGAVDALDRIAPGRTVELTVGDTGRLFVLDTPDVGRTIADVLPFVARVDELRQAAGLDAEVNVNSVALSVVVGPGEGPRYADLLRTLVDEYGVTSFHEFTGGGVPSQGAPGVRIGGDAAHAHEIEAAIRASGLRISQMRVVLREN